MTEIVGLRLPAEGSDAGSVVWFEVEESRWLPASGGGSVVGRLEESLSPLVAAARTVLGRMRELSPDSVEVEFGVKLAGEAGWVFAKAATEGHLTVTLGWRAGAAQAEAAPVRPVG
jgi:hypothetical protein